MIRVPTALLLHRTADDSHHDWLIGMPGQAHDPRARLWTARVGPASRHWRALGRFDLVAIKPHRSMYLDYQGPVPGGRGHVLRIDRGDAVVRLWRSRRIVLDLSMLRFSGRVELLALNPRDWLGRVLA